MLTVNDTFPEFNLKVVYGPDPEEVQVLDSSAVKDWMVVVAYPRDFTFVCPTELRGYNDLVPHFTMAGAVLLGLSSDHEHSHMRWLRDDLPELRFGLLADPTLMLGDDLGIINEDGSFMRATFIVDPGGTIRHVTVNDGAVGRDPMETLRVLHALNTGELTPCGWKVGRGTLGPA